MADIPESAIWAVAQALHRDYCDSHRVEWEHCLPKARAVLAAASPHLVAAAEARGRKQAADDIAGQLQERADHIRQASPRGYSVAMWDEAARIALAYAAGQDTG